MNRPVPLRTTMLVLNDDCLREVFEYLDEKQLCDVADTCNRFRSLAQETSEKSKHKKTLNTSEYYAKDRKYVLRLLRNFGQDIESISLSDYGWSIPRRDKIFVYVGRYCGRELKSLRLSCVGITEANVFELRPAIRNLEKLSLSKGRNGQALLVNLPVWSPKLRELNFSSPNERADDPGLRQAFPELKEVFFEDVRIGDLEAFLRRNQQLEGIGWNNCNDYIFRLVVEHVPRIRRLEINAVIEIYPNNMVYLNRLDSLEELRLVSFPSYQDGLPYFTPALDSLVSLSLKHFDFYGASTEWTQLKNLQILHLIFTRNMTAAHIIDVLINCRHLSYLILEGCARLKLSMDNFCDILRHGTALKRFTFIDLPIRDEEQIIFGADSYLRMVNIVQSRSNERIGTEFVIRSPLYVNGIPADLLAKHQHELKLSFLEVQQTRRMMTRTRNFN